MGTALACSTLKARVVIAGITVIGARPSSRRWLSNNLQNSKIRRLHCHVPAVSQSDPWCCKKIQLHGSGSNMLSTFYETTMDDSYLHETCHLEKPSEDSLQTRNGPNLERENLSKNKHRPLLKCGLPSKGDPKLSCHSKFTNVQASRRIGKPEPRPWHFETCGQGSFRLKTTSDFVFRAWCRGAHIVG